MTQTLQPMWRPRHALDKLLRTELATAATYEQALEHVSDPDARAALEKNRKSHAVRVVLLSQLVEERGGEPSNRAGPWGMFTKLVESAASLISERAILETLHVGERHITSIYRSELDFMGRDTPEAAIRDGLAEQLASEARLRDLLQEIG